jgi:redox-sensitive bicupin YhaK (pirin superfamily)
MSDSRRNFLKKTGLLASAVALSGAVINASTKDENMDTKTIKRIRPLGFQWETLDPFLFCVHHEDKYPEGNDNLGPDASLEGRNMGSDFVLKDGWRMYHGSKVPGFPGHPHRGFETITVVRDGLVDHADSLGGSARYGHGDVQWMTAGSGIQHSEMFPLVNKDKGNRLELFQIWLNLPKKSKMVTPYFKMNWSEDIPVIKQVDKNNKTSFIEVLAGSLWDSVAPLACPDSWAFTKENSVAIYAVKMEPNATLTIPKTEAGVNRSIYFFEGETLQLADTKLKHYHAADVESTHELEIVNGDTAAQFLLLQGKPIGEPVVQHGPFVMNTKEEIQETFDEYQRTQFGGWPWKTDSPVHNAAQSRFAKHPDGKEEKK